MLVWECQLFNNSLFFKCRPVCTPSLFYVLSAFFAIWPPKDGYKLELPCLLWGVRRRLSPYVSAVINCQRGHDQQWSTMGRWTFALAETYKSCEGGGWGGEFTEFLQKKFVSDWIFFRNVRRAFKNNFLFSPQSKRRLWRYLFGWAFCLFFLHFINPAIHKNQFVGKKKADGNKEKNSWMLNI